MLLQLRSMANRRLCRTRTRLVDAGFSLMELMVVLAFVGTLAAIAIPTVTRALASIRLNGAIRTIANMTAVTKTRAASKFSRARLYVDRTSNSFHVETWDSTVVPAQWVVDGGTTFLPVNVTFGFGVVGAPPANTQPAIQLAPACLDNAGAVVGNTDCIVFNSRGIPIDNAGAPTNVDALYITDGTTVLGVTVTGTGLIGVWSTPRVVAPLWTIA
jgi:prepilin-type N-terminal cleavage/methylation domain-containing protein